jgi:phenylalanyl-tRNA synthetase alpha subunit
LQYKKIEKLKMIGITFTALNMPEDHPARDMQDTFFHQRKSGCGAKNAHLIGTGAYNGKLKNHRYEYYHQVVYLEMKRFQRVHIVFFIKLKVYTLMKMFHLPIYYKPRFFCKRIIRTRITKIKVKTIIFPFYRTQRRSGCYLFHLCNGKWL